MSDILVSLVTFVPDEESDATRTVQTALRTHSKRLCILSLKPLHCVTLCCISFFLNIVFVILLFTLPWPGMSFSLWEYIHSKVKMFIARTK